MHPRRSLPVLIVALLVAACASGSATAPSAAPTAGAVDLQVYAAASLKTALAKAATAYAASNPGVAITVSTDSSTALEAKIEQGAPADVFLAADTGNPQQAVDGGFATGPVTTFAGNRLTVIVPTANPAGIGAPVDIGRSGVKVIACTDGVPIAKYTAVWLDKVKSLAAYGADFPARYAANIASREVNVGALVAKVALGEGDAGIVYATDARSSDKVKAIDIPADQNVPATYGGVVLKASAHADTAAAFLAWLAGPGGQAVMASFGFLAPGS